MKKLKYEDENFTDVKNLKEFTFFPGDYVSLDMAVLFPQGFQTPL